MSLAPPVLPALKDYQRAFLDFAIRCEALRFGEFTLKSGRLSPYFFNTGAFNTGARLAELGRFYAHAIQDSGIAFDMLYGPAYKGIPLVAATAIALADRHGRDVPYCFNRKEAKKYAEGGVLVGSPLAGRVLILDDVISAGLSVAESVAIIHAHGAEPAGVVIALNRQERGLGALSAEAEIRARHGLPVAAIVRLELLMAYLAEKPSEADRLAAVRAYYAAYAA